jgi:hypothetical protein
MRSCIKARAGLDGLEFLDAEAVRPHQRAVAVVQFDGSLRVARQAVFEERNAIVIEAARIIPSYFRNM